MVRRVGARKRSGCVLSSDLEAGRGCWLIVGEAQRDSVDAVGAAGDERLGLKPGGGAEHAPQQHLRLEGDLRRTAASEHQHLRAYRRQKRGSHGRQLSQLRSGRHIDAPDDQQGHVAPAHRLLKRGELAHGLHNGRELVVVVKQRVEAAVARLSEVRCGHRTPSRHARVEHASTRWSAAVAHERWSATACSVKPQEYLHKRVELMKTFYEARIPYYGRLNEVFKISVLVRSSC